MPRTVHTPDTIYTISPSGEVHHTLHVSPPEWHLLQDPPSESVLSLEAHPSLPLLYLSTMDGHIHIYSMTTHARTLCTSAPLPAPALCLFPHPEENALYAGTADGAVLVVDLAGLEFVRMLGEGGLEHSGSVNAFAADATFLFTGGEDALVMVWELETGRAVRSISIPTAPVRSLLRLGDSLWVGMCGGALQVLEIYGDDSNSIENMSPATPHKGPISELVAVGEQEVWSLCAPGSNAFEEMNGARVAIWDARDLSYTTPEDLAEQAITSVTVIERTPFQDVALLALDSSLSGQLFSRVVSGRLKEHVDEEDDDSREVLIADLENQLMEANTELQRQRSLQRTPPEIQAEDFRRSSLVFSPVAVALKQTSGDNLPDGKFQPPNGDAATGSNVGQWKQRPSLTLSASVTEALQISLGRVSELLVRLLTDEVLTSRDDAHAKNEALRTAVADITTELNVGRQLVSCATANAESSSVIGADENNPALSAQNSSCCDLSVLRVRQRLDREVDKCRVLEKDLSVVTKERDFFAEDFQQREVQSTSTMSSLQSMVEDYMEQIKSKDAVLEDLQKKYELSEKVRQEESRLRKEQETLVKERLDELSVDASTASKSYDERLVAACEEIATKSHEIQSLRDSLRAMEERAELIKEDNHALESKCKSLDEKLADVAQRERDTEKQADARMTLKEMAHRDEIVALQQKHDQIAHELQAKCDGLASRIRSLTTEMEEAQANSIAMVEALTKERDEIRTSLLAAATKAQSQDSAHASSLEELESKMEDVALALKKGQDEWEDKEEVLHQQASMEVKICKEKFLVQLDEKDARIQGLEQEISDLQEKTSEAVRESATLSNSLQRLVEEKNQLEEELEHRIVASKLYEAETLTTTSVIENLKNALMEVHEALDNAEREVRELKEHVENTSYVEGSQQLRIEQLEKQIEENRRLQSQEVEGIGDNKNAFRALLASANGEIEQMTEQLDAMHRTQLAQEKELNELREGLAFRDDIIRRNKATLEAMPMEKIGVGVEENIGQVDGSDLASDVPDLHPLPSAMVDRDAKFGRLHRAPEGLPEVPVPESAETCVNEALDAAKQEMERTKQKLGEISAIAHKYKEAAEAHREALPALIELEGELLRVCRQDSRKASLLKSARGVVQSMIAQYYSDSEKVTVLRAYDENIYAASPERQNALEEAVARMRILRTGAENPDFPFELSFSEHEQSLFNSTDRPPHDPLTPGDGLQTPRRYLSF